MSQKVRVTLKDEDGDATSVKGEYIVAEFHTYNKESFVLRLVVTANGEYRLERKQGKWKVLAPPQKEKSRTKQWPSGTDYPSLYHAGPGRKS